MNKAPTTSTCIYCNKIVYVPLFKKDRVNIIEVEQRGKYAKKLYAHTKCYERQTIGAVTNKES